MNMLTPATTWTISVEERRQCDEQFRSLGPINGFITGNQAREFFLKSNLPAPVLAQIWELADVNKDGKMDQLEFSIAMHLIKKKLQGISLPTILPESLKKDPGIIPSMPAMTTLPPMIPQGPAFQMPGVRPWFPPQMGQPMVMQPAFYGVSPITAPITASTPVQPQPIGYVDWSMPQSNKLKFSQQFNTLDKDKTGFLTGAQARSVFSHSDLPSAILAKIWFLADLDKDGKLTVDEFCIASHLIDMAKRGITLPSSLPPELSPANWHRGFGHQRRASLGTDDISLSPGGSSMVSYETGDIIKAPRMTTTFDEKRRMNLERGQAEIERRRQMLQEQENREREQRERKQREERERQEREKEEQERRRLMELEKEQARFREEQGKREQEYKRMLEQKDMARKEAERQRQSEFERQRVQELQNQRQREQETIFHSRQRQKNLSFQVQALSEKAQDLNARITALRTKVINSTDSFETMKSIRDNKLVEIDNGKRLVQDLRTKTMQCENEKMHLLAKKRAMGLSMVTPTPDSMSGFQNSEAILDSKRRSLAEIEAQIRQKQLISQSAEKSSSTAIEQARKQASEYHSLVQRINVVLSTVRQRKPVAGGHDYWKNSNGHKLDNAQSVANTVWYQVVYDFEAANEGELSLRVGELVLVFIDHPVEEGWLAGQLGDKIGWFPKDFAIPLGNGNASAAAEEVTATSNTGHIETAPIEAAQVPVSNNITEHEIGEWYVAEFPFPAAEAGDLGFEAGEKVLVLQKTSDWWTGRIGDRKGIFPSNYVQKLDTIETIKEPTVEPVQSSYEDHQEEASSQSQSPAVTTVAETVQQNGQKKDDVAFEVARAIAQYQAADQNQLSLEVGDLIKIRSKSPTGWWEGELQRKGERQRVGWFPGNYVEVLNSARPDTTVQSSDTEAPGEQEMVEALFDYQRQHDDELSFTRGSLIVIIEKCDNDWWKGRLDDGQEGLVPTNYVKERSLSHGHRNGDLARDESRRSSVASTPTSELRKRNMYCQELEQTEQNYIDDLQMVIDVFYKQLEVSGLLAPKEMSKLFINWTELADVARSFVSQLRSAGEDRIGVTILKNLDTLKTAFITFCRHQQSALEFLNSKEKSAARFRALHAQCSQHPAARGLQLSYFLLIPLARVTKYHLVVNEILKYTPKEHGDYENLRNAHTALRQLCNEVNEVATETENLQMLYWCQNHIKCESIQPRLVFHSPTNNMGPRRILHSGILYKARSNRLLIALLFNDFLMLTTPDEKISQPETFKLTRTSEISLALYKSPILLSKTILQSNTTATGDSENSTSSDDQAITLAYGEDTIALKAISNNARILWTKQLDKAIKAARDVGSARAKTVTISSSGIGRLLFEVVFVRDLVVPQDCKGASFYIEFTFGQQKHTKSIDLARTDTLCTTQMILDSKSGSMKLAIFAERIYSPDICVGRTEIDLASMLKMSGSQRNPAVKQLPLTSDFAATSETVSGQIIVKFVVQLFDDQ